MVAIAMQCSPGCTVRSCKVCLQNTYSICDIHGHESEIDLQRISHVLGTAVVPPSEPSNIYLQHEIGLVEVDDTGCATCRFQAADLEVNQVIDCLRGAWHGVQAAQEAVSISCAGRGNGKDITLGQ